MAWLGNEAQGADDAKADTRSFVALAALAAFAALVVVPVSGQGSPAPPPLVVTAFRGPTPIYKMPRTPWGDPDLQGCGRVTT